MKKLLLCIVFLGAIAFATTAEASPILTSINFCPAAASCPDGVTEASITVYEDPSADVNDYNFLLRISGDLTAPAYVDELSFTIGGSKTPDDFATRPTLVSAPVGSNYGPITYDNVSGNVLSCAADTNQANETCIPSLGANNYGASLPGLTLEWLVYANFVEGLSIDEETKLNLRAQFLDSEFKNAGILSPNSIGTPGGGDDGLTPVPEPASMILLGTGLAGVVAASRRRRQTT